MKLGTLDTAENVAARVLSILPRANLDRKRYEQVYGPEMAVKADTLSILLSDLMDRGWFAVDTPANRKAFADHLRANPDLVDALSSVTLDSSPFRQVLAEELDEIARVREIRLDSTKTQNLKPDLSVPEQRAGDMSLIGLAFSGGGIRSATFNLGVLQALAERGLLRRVDYLSTVSGGGYIGSWLVSWIHQCGIHTVEKALSPRHSPHPQQDDVRPIEFLRDYSNYLAPKPGMFSADTWTIAAEWFRNTLLNLIVVVATGCCVLMLPRIAGLIAKSLADAYGPLVENRPLNPILLLSMALLLPVVWSLARNLRTPPAPSAPSFWWRRQTGILAMVIAPVLFSAVVLNMAVMAMVRPHAADFVWAQIVVHLIPTAVSVGLLLVVLEHVGEFYGYYTRGGHNPLLALVALISWPVLSAAFCLAMLTVVARLHAFWALDGDAGFWRSMVWGPGMVLAVFSTTLIIQVGLMGRNFPDDRREWLSRLGAWMGIVLVGVTALFVVAFHGPYYLLKAIDVGSGLGAGITLGWIASTASGLLASRDPKPVANAPGQQTQPGRLRSALISVAPYVFIAGLFIGLSMLLTLAFTAAAGHSYDSVHTLVTEYWTALSATNGWSLAAAFVFCAAVALLFSRTVDVNEFSMHHFYKNRLVRCYLGAGRCTDRSVDPFTGFDRHDDRPIARLRHDYPKGGYAGPFPIINTTLNLVHGDRLSWQERKGASFVFTPKYCGFPNGRTEALAVDPDQVLPPHPSGIRFDCPAYRPTDVYAYPVEGDEVGGPYLGTAVAISGAAATPNMGYHSSAPSAFLMTVFNVRLGWWLGNPLLGKWRESGPAIGLYYLLAELFGMTNIRRSYVYLSDGGHFENLGIYELVRRRCPLIIASDAEQDGTMSFGGLGNAIRKCRMDFGVEIDIDPRRIAAKENGFSEQQFAVGTIRYPERDPRTKERVTGTLFYLKSSMTGREPVDLLEYRRREPAFPHQSTGDQFFDESQFESYRKLGYAVTQNALAAGLDQLMLGAKSAAV